MDIENSKEDIKLSNHNVSNNGMEIEEEPKKNKNVVKDKVTEKVKKPQPKFKLITCPFVNYLPAEIEQFCFNSILKLLAIVRNDSSIELWNYPSWSYLTSIKCTKSAQPKSVAWLSSQEGFNNFSLLVAHVNGTLSIYDLKSIHPTITKITSTSGIWDMKVINNNIALSYDDGSVKIYHYDGESDLYLQKSLRSFPEKALCIEWGLAEENILFVGYEKGIIRKFDFKTNNVITTMKLAKQDIIWKIIYLEKDDQLFAGSSDGNISIFDTKFGVISQQLKTHEGDILTLEKNSSGTTVYVSGVDSKIVSIQKVFPELLINQKAIQENKWIISSNDRGQSHDVKSIILLQDDLLISGGITTDICLYKLENGKFPDRRPNLASNKKDLIKLKHITSLPQSKVVHVAIDSNQILFQKAFGLELWNLNTDLNQYEFLIEIKIKDSPIICAAISRNGKYIAYSTLEEAFIFKFDLKTTSLVKMIDLEPMLSANFYSSSTKLFGITKNSTCFICDIHKGCKTKNVYTLENIMSGLLIDSEISQNDDIIALGSKLTNTILILHEMEDGNAQMVEIPKLMENQTYTCFKFKINSDCIVIVYENNRFVVYNWRNKNITKWTRENLRKFPINYLQKKNKIIGIICDPIHDSKLILYSNYYLIQIHLNEPIPKSSITVWQDNTVHNSNEKKDDKINENFKISYRKNPIIHFQAIKDKKLLCIETNWKDLVHKLPGALNAKKYGL